MTFFDLEARERCKALVNKQALPTRYFPFYVVVKYSWCADYHLIGFDDEKVATNIAEEYLKKGASFWIATSYPFEIMNPEKKK